MNRLVRKLLRIPSGTKDISLGRVGFNSGTDLPPMCPVVTLHRDSESIFVMNLCPSRVGGHNYPPYNTGHLSAKKVTEMPDKGKGVLDDREVQIVDKLDKQMLHNVTKNIKDIGAITFVLSDIRGMKNAHKLVMGSVPDLYPQLSLMSNPLCLATKSRSDLDELCMAMTIYNIENFIPVFNTKRADGIVIVMSLFWPRATAVTQKLSLYDETVLGANKFKENLLYIDGQPQYKAGWLNKGHIHYFDDVMRAEKRRRSTVKSDGKSLIEVLAKIEEDSPAKSPRNSTRGVRVKGLPKINPFDLLELEVDEPAGWDEFGRKDTPSTAASEGLRAPEEAVPEETGPRGPEEAVADSNKRHYYTGTSTSTNHTY